MTDIAECNSLLAVGLVHSLMLVDRLSIVRLYRHMDHLVPAPRVGWDD